MIFRFWYFTVDMLLEIESVINKPSEVFLDWWHLEFSLSHIVLCLSIVVTEVDDFTLLHVDLKLFDYSLTEQVLDEVMDAKCLGVMTLSAQNILQPWQTRLTPSFRFCVATWRAAQRSLSKLLSFIHSFMEFGATVWNRTKSTTVIKLRGCSKVLQK